MVGLGLALACAGLFALAVVGVRMVRSTGLEDVEEFRQPVHSGRQRGFSAMIDSLGDRLLGVTMRAYGAARLRRLEELIRRAGRPDGLTLMVYVRRQGALVFVGVVLLLLFSVVGLMVVGVIALVVMALWMPVWLRSVSRSRTTRIDAELPDFLDVLGVTVSAGLSFRQAVERVCEVSEGPLAEEMTTVLREMSLGVSRRQAFVALRERVRSDAVASFVTALLQAEELGVPLADALVNISGDARREHAEYVRQAMARAQPKASLVITLTIVPGAIVLIGATVVLSNQGILHGLF